MRLAGDTGEFPVFFPSPKYCTDNAAMIACAAYYRYRETPQCYHQQNFLDLEAHANLAISDLHR